MLFFPSSLFSAVKKLLINIDTIISKYSGHGDSWSRGLHYTLLWNFVGKYVRVVDCMFYNTMALKSFACEKCISGGGKP